MSLKPVQLKEFLANSNVPSTTPPPLVHSTPAKNAYSVFGERKLLALRCNVFQEELCYCFVGRPAYKWETDKDAKYWQLPLVVIARSPQGLPLKRVFPFDSGAFARKRIPDYITTFSFSNYDIAPEPENIGRLISVFFRDSKQYFQGKPRGEEGFRAEHSLTPRHQEIEALFSLYNDVGNRQVDDRKAAIEIQFAEDVNLASDNLVGVVLPSEYRRDAELINAVASMTRNIRFYDI